MLTTSMSLSKILSLLLFGLLLTLDESVAFAPLVVAPSSSTSTTRLNGLFGGLSDAFKK